MLAHFNLRDALRPCYTKPFFLQLATQRWWIKNVFSCRGGVTRLQLFLQLATRTITNKMAYSLSERKMSSDWPILTKLRCKLLRECYTQATCLATLRKVEGRSTFLTTRNARIAVAKWGVTREFFPATCNATNVALQVARKIASCNMAFSINSTNCNHTPNLAFSLFNKIISWSLSYNYMFH